MDDNFKQFDIFDRYAAGEMTTAEKADFETKLGKDPELSRLYEAFVRFRDDLRIALVTKPHRESIRGLMAEIREAEAGKQSAPGGKTKSLNRFGFWRRALPAAAAVALLLIAAVWWWASRPGYGKIVADLYQPEREAIEFELAALASGYASGPIAYDPGILDTLKQGLAHYDKGEPARAKLLLQLLADRYPSLETARFYLALSQFETADSNGAIRNMTILKNDPGSKWQPLSVWYLALFKLKINKPSEAKELLQQAIPHTKDPYRERMQALLEKIK